MSINFTQISLRSTWKYRGVAFLLILLCTRNISAQVSGDFRSFSDGDWNNTGTWETFDGVTWNAAVSLPTSSSSVWIQDGDSIGLSANAVCKDLHLNAEIDAADSARLTTQSFTLAVNGKLRTYSGSKGTIPGTNSTGLNNSLRFISTTGGGKIQITGTTHNATESGQWGVPSNFHSWNLEIAMNSATDTAKFNSNMRAGNITIASGVLQMVQGAGTLRPDGGSTGTGTLTINSGARLVMNTTTIARTSSERFGTFTLNSGGIVVLPSTAAACALAATTSTLNGTVISENGSGAFIGVGGISGAATMTTFNNLTINAAVTFTQNITINGTLTLGAKITTSSSFMPTMGAGAMITGASSSNFVNGPLSMTVASVAPTILIFEIGKSSTYRRATLAVTQSSATSTVYTAEVFNAAPTSRALGTLTNVSNTRYWTITKGTGASVTAASVALTYGTDDGVSDHTAIRVAKDDGAGNWVNLAGTGTTSLSGTITSVTNFSTFSDFVIANVTQINSGDFRSKQDGDWNSTSTWETFDGSTWSAAGSLPTSTNSVWIQDGDSVGLSANATCKDLHLNADIDAADSARLTTQSFTLAVSGKLRTYTGTTGNIPGANSTGLNNSLRFISTTGGGKIQITGTTHNATESGQWGVPSNFHSWNLEIAMNSATDTAKFNSNMRAGNITIASGVLQMVQGAGTLRPDGGSTGTGTLTINSGARLVMNTTTIARTASERFGTFTLNSGGIVVLPSTAAACALAATTCTLNGTVISENGSGAFIGVGGISGAATMTTFNNLTINAAVTFTQNITVNGLLTLGAKITTSSSFMPTLGAGASISGASSSNFVNGPLAMTVASTSPTTLTFEIGKSSTYRKATLSVTHSSSTSTVYTAEVFNAAPTSRALGTLTNVSNTRYWNITKGAGASVTAATVTLTYGADDGVSDHTAIRVAKDDGAGNWVNLAGTGTTSLSGTITSVTNFTSFSDFVIANVTQINTGDFRSKQDGDWGSTSTWETFNGSTWSAASSTPTSTNSVWIQDGDSVGLSSAAACKDLHLNADIDAADSARLTTQGFTLAVNGKIRTYTGSTGNIPGANSTGLNNSLRFISTTGGGKIQITGTTRNVTESGQWGVPANFHSWNLEFAMNSATDTAKVNTNIRAGTITIASGTVQMVQGAGTLRPDGGSTATGTLAISSGAKLVMNSTTIARTASERFGTFNLNSGGIIVLPSTAGSCAIAANSVTLSGTVISENGGIIGTGAISGAASMTSFSNFTANSAITLGSNITISGLLTLNAIITTSSSAKPTLGHSASISGASTTAFINGPLSRTVSGTSSATRSFPVGKGTDFRPVTLIVIQNAPGNSTVYTAEMINSPAPGHTLPTGITHVSGQRYFTITSDNASTINTGIVTIVYDTDDGVSDFSNLRMVKDDGAGNWIDLAGAGSGNGSGFITSGNNFTSFSDFALANATGGTNPLPVSLMNFNAELQKDKVYLSWATASETNNKGFEVERSANGKDFEKIGFVPGHNNSSIIRLYDHEDKEALRLGATTLYYRLKQVDNNDDFSYSPIRLVKLNNIHNGVVLYPNPTSKYLNLAADGFNGNATVEIVDITGRIMRSQDLQVLNGKAGLELDGLPRGFYFVQVRINDLMFTEKILVQ